MSTMKLLPVSVIEEENSPEAEPIEAVPERCGAIHIELPGAAWKAVSIRPWFARCPRVCTRGRSSGEHEIWIAAGVTDMRRGFHGLNAQVQTVLEQQPLSGHVFVFLGHRGDIVKVLWFDGDGLCLLAKRPERGRFVWPQASSGAISLSRAQLSMLL